VIVVTSEFIQGKRIVKTLGIVRGSTVRSMHVGRDILAIFRNLVGGEIEEYTKMLAEAREQALDRMIHDAERLGANAIICMRYSTSDIARGAAEILIYGTGVLIEDAPPRDIERLLEEEAALVDDSDLPPPAAIVEEELSGN
jgi:uncharacterized protein YbjQ (UPF0145 family)